MSNAIRLLVSFGESLKPMEYIDVRIVRNGLPLTEQERGNLWLEQLQIGPYVHAVKPAPMRAVPSVMRIAGVQLRPNEQIAITVRSDDALPDGLELAAVVQRADMQPGLRIPPSLVPRLHKIGDRIRDAARRAQRFRRQATEGFAFMVAVERAADKSKNGVLFVYRETRVPAPLGKEVPRWTLDPLRSGAARVRVCRGKRT